MRDWCSKINQRILHVQKIEPRATFVTAEFLELIGGPVSCTLGLRGFPRAATISEKEQSIVDRQG